MSESTMDDLLSMFKQQAADAPQGDSPADDPVRRFCTVEEANRELQRRMMDDADGKAIRTVAHAIAASDDICGTADEYHNIIQDFFRISDYLGALEVARKGLSFYPSNIDLLANAIRAAANTSDFDACDAYEGQARAAGTQYWNWRLFTFLIDAYKARFDTVATEAQRQELYNRAHGIADEYLEHFPTDDRAFNAKAELYILANEREKAMEVLGQAIGTARDQQTGTKILAPTCCVTYLDILEPGDEATCRLIIQIAQKGLHSTAEEQPSANIGYFVYREALARDALIAMQGDGRGYTDTRSVEKALGCYECAYALLRGRSYARTIEQRYAILKSRGEGDFSERRLPE